jgi:hypothetical protein
VHHRFVLSEGTAHVDFEWWAWWFACPT